MNCLKCELPLTEDYKSEKYCSRRCARNYGKIGWRKRNQESINKYNRENRQKYFGYLKQAKLLPKEYCLRCYGEENLNYHHVRPTKIGGENKLGNIIVLCFRCHMLWHEMFPDNYWRYSPKRYSPDSPK